MITRFDHAVIAAADLEQARRLYGERLGFVVYPGGRHTGLGTENAIVRFGLDYLELLGIYSREEVAAAGIKRASLLDFLADRPGGMLGFCMATDDIDALAARFQAMGLDALGPYAMERMRPDGVLLQWRLLVPGGTAWRRPWPFFIQWGMDDAARLDIEKAGSHPNGVRRVVGVLVVVNDLAAAHRLYAEQIGLAVGSGVNAAGWPNHYVVGDFTISLVEASADAAAGHFLQTHGEGLYQVLLAADDTRRVWTHWKERGVLRTGGSSSTETDPTATLGAHLVVVD
jgi:extradiol dioxygenase family protein